MKSSRLLFFLGALASFVFISGLGQAAVAAPAKTPPPPPDMRKMIKSVDAKTSTVVIIYMHSKLLHTYKVDGNTALKVNNQDGKFADIKAGMVVDDYLERDNDDLDSLSISGNPTAPTPAAKPKAPAKPKPAAAPAPAPTQ